MKIYKDKIGIAIYVNPDHYPPIINTIQILAREFDLVVICRNQGKPKIHYPKNIKLYRLGKLKTPREKETQGLVMKAWEYILFSLRAIFYLRFYRCQLIYSYDMHGFIAGFFASRLGRKVSLIYHNLDLAELRKQKGLTYMIKYLELRFARYADKIVFPDINRVKFFLNEAKLAKLPDIDIVMNAPLCINKLPPNRLIDVLRVKGFSIDTKIVLYQGTIGNAQTILEVIKSMNLWPKDTVLVLIGTIIDEDFAKDIDMEAGALHLTNRIIKLSFIEYLQLFSYTVGAYIGLALFKPKNINLTFAAGASNKIFEYISMGIPIVTNNSPYFRGVVNSSIAYFAQPDSVEDIARVINYAFSDIEEYHKKSQAARQAHLTLFNYEKQFQPIIEYIREVT